MKQRPWLLAFACGAVTLAGCAGNGSTSSKPDDAVIVLDRDGTAVGWLTADDDSGEDWIGLIRQNIDALGLTDRVRAGDIEVRTTIDTAMQDHLSDAAQSVPDTEGRFAVAAIAVDVADGGVVAIVDTNEGDLTSIRRPTGSALKFLIATAAMREGAQASDLLDGNERCAIPTATGVTTFSGDPERAMAPLSDMTAFSVNCAFGKLYEIVGGDRVLGLAQRLGLTGVAIDTPAIATGAASETPFEMAAAMRVVLGDGTYTRPFIIERITDVDGADLFIHGPQVTQVIGSDVAGEVATLLTDVVERGTARSAALDGGRPVAAKTGTQEGNTDAWIVGGTPQLAVAIWMGNPANPRDGMVEVEEFTGVPRVQGGTYPALVFKEFLDRSLGSAPLMSWPPVVETRSPVRLVLPGLECALEGVAEPMGLPAVAVDATIDSC